MRRRSTRNSMFERTVVVVSNFDGCCKNKRQPSSPPSSLQRAYHYFSLNWEMPQLTVVALITFLSWLLFTAQQVSGIFLPIIRSSMTAVAASGLTFVSWCQSCGCSGWGRRAGPAPPPPPPPPHDSYYDTKVKPEAPTAVIELLMMGRKTPETCWAVKKLRIINWKIVASGWWFIWIVRWCTDLQNLNFTFKF
jgi:hypothetical protein